LKEEVFVELPRRGDNEWPAHRVRARRGRVRRWWLRRPWMKAPDFPVFTDDNRAPRGAGGP
jgi:hypothetical protein